MEWAPVLIKGTRKWNQGYLSVHSTLYSWAYTWRGCAGHKRFGECCWYLLILVPKCLFHYIPTLFIFLFITSLIIFESRTLLSHSRTPNHMTVVPCYLLPPPVFLISIYHSLSSSILIIIIDFALYSRGSRLIWGSFL